MKFQHGGEYLLPVVGRNGRGGIIILPGRILTSRGDGTLDARPRKGVAKFIALERVNANEKKRIGVRLI